MSDSSVDPIKKMRKSRYWPPGIPKPKPGAYSVGSRWTREQEELLRRYYAQYGSRYCARLLGRTMLGVRNHALLLNIPGPALRGWSDREVLYLRRYHQRMTMERLAEKLGRSEASIVKAVRRLGLSGDERSWTKKELDYIRKNYRKMPFVEIARHLRRTPDAVKVKAGRLGLAKPTVKFSRKQVEWVLDNLGKLTYAEMAERLGVFPIRLMKLAARHGYHARPNNRAWTADEDEFLRRNHGKMTRAEIARQLERTAGSVGQRMTIIGITRDSRRADLIRPWTEDEDRMMREIYGTVSREEVARRMNRTVIAVTRRAGELGLRRPRGQTKAEYVRLRAPSES
jgi:hypothetical protein